MCSNCHLSIHLRIQSLSIHHPPVHHPPTHLPTCVFICSSNYPLIPLFIQPSTELQLTYPFPINPVSYSSTQLPTYPPTHSPIYPTPTNPLPCSSPTHPSMHQFISMRLPLTHQSSHQCTHPIIQEILSTSSAC